MVKASHSILSLHQDDRPREKLLTKGTSALSNAELLAIILGSGNRQMNAIQLAQHILKSHQNSLLRLSRISVQEFMQFPGIGPAKAVSLVAALELSRRRKLEDQDSTEIIRDSQSAYHLLEPHLCDLIIEEFWVLFLNQQNKLIRSKKISQGGFTATYVDRRVIMKEALLLNAVAIVLAHNHPSGNRLPSDADIKLTKQIQEAGQLMGVRIIDHLIITNQNYTSFADDGLL